MDGLGVFDGVKLRVCEAVYDGVNEIVADGEGVPEALAVTVLLGVRLGVDVTDVVALGVRLAVCEGVRLTVNDGVRLAVRDGVFEG